MVFSMPLNFTKMIEEIKQEIDRLRTEQNEALKSATYVGMTAEEAHRHDARRDRITRLLQQLQQLQQAP
jgi:hypothetical protein